MFWPLVDTESDPSGFKGFITNDVAGDGNCLFTCFSRRVFGDDTHSHEMRCKVVAHIRKHGSVFEPSCGEPLRRYCAKMSIPGRFGDDICIAAFAHLQNLKVVVKAKVRDGSYETQIYTSKKPHVVSAPFRIHLDLARQHDCTRLFWART
jgi:hypothetical protein